MLVCRQLSLQISLRRFPRCSKMDSDAVCSAKVILKVRTRSQHNASSICPCPINHLGCISLPDVIVTPRFIPAGIRLCRSPLMIPASSGPNPLAKHYKIKQRCPSLSSAFPFRGPCLIDSLKLPDSCVPTAISETTTPISLGSGTRMGDLVRARLQHCR
jgi:hypothetical protein